MGRRAGLRQPPASPARRDPRRIPCPSCTKRRRPPVRTRDRRGRADLVHQRRDDDQGHGRLDRRRPVLWNARPAGFRRRCTSTTTSTRRSTCSRASSRSPAATSATSAGAGSFAFLPQRHRAHVPRRGRRARPHVRRAGRHRGLLPRRRTARGRAWDAASLRGRHRRAQAGCRALQHRIRRAAPRPVVTLYAPHGRCAARPETAKGPRLRAFRRSGERLQQPSRALVTVQTAAPTDPTAATASRITSVTAWGCEIMITWEPSTSVIVAPARSAIGTDHIGAGRFVAGGDDGPGGQVLPGGRPRRLRERQLGDGPLRGGHHRASPRRAGRPRTHRGTSPDRSRTPPPARRRSRRIVKGDQRTVQDAVLRAASASPRPRLLRGRRRRRRRGRRRSSPASRHS